MADRVTFTPRSAQRIADAVLKVEAGDRNNRGVMFTVPPSSDKVFRMCTFTGAWSKNTVKVVAFRNQTTTLNATNLFADIAGNTSTATVKACAIAKDGTAWYLIAAEC